MQITFLIFLKWVKVQKDMKKVVQQSKLPLTKKALFKVQHSNTNAGPYWMYNRLKKTVVHTHSKSSESSLHRVSPVPEDWELQMQGNCAEYLMILYSPMKARKSSRVCIQGEAWRTEWKSRCRNKVKTILGFPRIFFISRTETHWHLHWVGNSFPIDLNIYCYISIMQNATCLRSQAIPLLEESAD